MKTHALVRFWTWCFTACLSFACTVNAQTYHVRAGATGANNGSDWNNAFSTLPNTLVRGATYYVAAGSYGSYTFDDALSGTNLITIKKATVEQHGSNTGWQNSYATGQAVWTWWEFTRGYYLIDGVTRNPDWRSGYGFKVQNNSPSPAIRMTQAVLSHVTISHLELQGLGRYIGDFSSQPSPSVDDGFYMFSGHSYITLRNGYYHDIEGAAFKSGGNSYITIEYCVIARNRTDPWFHGTAWGGSDDDNIIMRHNIWEDICGTATISQLNRGSGSAVNANWEIYGNVFCNTPGNNIGGGDGTIAVINQQSAVNWKIYNNSFIGLGGLSSRISVGVNGASGNSNVKIYNNFWWNSKPAGHTLNNCTDCAGSNNRYDATSSSATEANRVVNTTASTSVFVNHAGKNFRLAAPTEPGLSLPSPYNVDLDGRTRGADGVWDRGAYEYASGGADTTPPAVSGVAAVSVGATNATITWNTDEASTTVVQYGLTTSYGSTVSDPNYVFAHTRTISGLAPNTTYNYRVQSVDVAGNTATSGNFTFQTAVLDTTAPTVSISAPTSGLVVSNTVTITATAADNVGVAGVQFLIDGQAVGGEDTTAPYSFSWDSWSAANGVRTVQARARDAAGNTTTSAAVNFQVLNQTAGGLPPGQVGYWSFNEGSGSTSAGNPGGAATLQSGTTWIAGRVGNALSFNGTTGHAVIADSPGLRVTNALTLAMWVRHATLPPASGGFMHYLEKGLDDHDNYGIGIGNGPQGLQLYFEFEDTTGVYRRFQQSGNVTLSTGNWSHLAVVFDDANNIVRFYQNGVQVGTATVTQSMNTGLNHPLYIGRENFAAYPWPLNAAVDEVRVFNRALTAAEVFAVYQANDPTGPTPPSNLRIVAQ